MRFKRFAAATVATAALVGPALGLATAGSAVAAPVSTVSAQGEVRNVGHDATAGHVPTWHTDFLSTVCYTNPAFAAKYQSQCDQKAQPLGRGGPDKDK